MNNAFKLLESHDEVWECDSYGDLYAINYEKAEAVLRANGIKNINSTISLIADLYGIDID